MRKLYAFLLTVFYLAIANTVFAQAPTITAEVEPNGTTGTAQVLNLTLQNTTIVAGAVNPAADIDWYRIDGVTAGSKFWGYVDPGGTQNPGANSRDPQIRIFAADGTTLIEFDDDDGTGNGGDGTSETGLASSIAGRTLTAGGTYYIQVVGFSATNVINPYKLFVTVTPPGAASAEVEPNGTAATANSIVTALQTTGVRTGTISSSGEVDFYSVVAVAGNVIYVSMDGDPSRTGVNTLDGVVSIIAPDGTTVLLSGDSGFGGANNSEGFSWNVLASGTYYIRVAGFGTESGRDYALMVSAAQPNPAASLPPVCTPEIEPNGTTGTAQVLDLTLQNVTIVCGSVNPSNDLDWYRIDGIPAGAKFWGYVDPGGTQNPGANSRDPQLRIFAADGTTLIEFDDDDGTGNGGDGTTETGFASSIAGRTLTAGGTYYIQVKDFSTGVINPYKMFIVVTPPGAGSPEVEPNGTAATANSIVTASQSVGVRTGAISSSGEVDFYSVEALAGHVIYMSLDGDPSRTGVNTLDGVVSVIAPDGTTVLLSGDSGFGGANNSEGFSWNVITSGTYYIRVAGFSTESGRNYALMVAGALSNVTPPPNDLCSNAVTINCGQTINGTSVNATADAAPTCTVTTNPGVWYTFTGVGAIETLSTCSAASFDTRLSVYRGTCAALICVAGNDDFCGNRAEVSFPTTAGTTYYVLVHGTAGATGTFSLTRTCPPPCTGVPSPGAITPSSTSVCVGTPVVLTVSGYTNVTGLAFQWREATTSGGTYTNIPGATGTTYSFNAPASTRYYVCTVTCTNPGGGSATTAEVVVNVGNVQHSSITATPNSGICSPGTSVITATAAGGIGNYTHTLTGPGTIGAPVVTGANNQNVSFTVTNIPAGTHTYTLTSTDGIGCSKASTVNVTVNQTPIITMTTVPPGPLFTNYTVSSSGGNAIVPGTTLVPGSQGDDLTVAIPLPFTYYAYGTGYTSLRASSNGNLQFSGGGNAAFTNTCPLPTTTALGFPSFMPHWDDVRTDINAGDGIYTSVSGVAPNRIFNIEWRGSLFAVGGSTVSFEARLYEAEQRVDFIYGTNTNNGSSASVGIQGAVGPTTSFTQFSCNSASLSSGLMVSFVAPSVTICNGDIVRIDASAVPASPQTFTSLVNTHIPAGGTTTGIASPYPNTLTVSGLATSGISVKSVTINSYSHTFPDDVDLVLVSPSGTQSVILMSDAGGGTDATGQNFTFDDAAPTTLADAAFNPTGTYRPTNFGAGDNWPAPGPLGTPSSTTLSTFTGNMNGDWKLYAFDDAGGDVGFVGTWSITFNIPQPVVFSPVTNLFTDAAATIAYTGTPAYTVWARPNITVASYTATSTIAGCSNTATVNITVNQRPVINTQPTAPAAPVCPGFNTTFTVGATATNIAYQWQRSIDNGTTWVNVPEDALHTGTTTASITVVNPQIPQNGHRYRVIVSGVCPPAVTSNSVTLVVATPPTITTQPANRIVCAPDAAVFTVVAGGTPAPNIYQWQVSTNSGGTWTNLTTGGSYTPTLTVSPTTTSQTGSWYRVIVTNNCGQSVTSNNATLTVNAPTPVTIAPLPTRICISDTLVNLSATPVGGSWSGIGVSGFNFVPSATAVGTYTLTYTYVNAAGCTSTGTVAAQVVDCPERIRQLDDNAVILFPNPNNGRFNIRINSVLYNYLGMNVYNTAGQLLHRQTFGGLVYGRVVPIDLNHLPAGAYMVKFFYDDGIRTNEKTFPVIIQRQ